MLKGYEKMELSTQIVIEEAMARELEVKVLDEDDNFISLKKGDRIEYVKQATRTSADTYISPLIMENKVVTKLLLNEAGITVPKGITVRCLQEAADNHTVFSDGDIVVKPKSTNFGKGVVILKKPFSREEFLNAVEAAFEYDTSVMIEEFIPGREFRFLVIGGEVAAVLHRVPANVEGDGVHTIEELVQEKNKDPLRGKGYVTPLEKINLGETEKEYLRIQERNIGSIPEKGETVFLRENSNISTGGDSIDFTDEMPGEYKKIAVDAARAVGARICGADIIIDDIHAIPERNNYGIIELNFNPALHIHDFPYKGIRRNVGGKVLDLLGF